MGVDPNYMNTFVASVVEYYSRHSDSIIKLLPAVESDSGMIERPLYDEPAHLFFVNKAEMDGGFPVYTVEQFTGESGGVSQIADVLKDDKCDVIMTVENISPSSPDSRMVYGWRIKNGRVLPMPYAIPTNDEWGIIPGAYFDGSRLEVEDLFVDQLAQLLNVAPVGHHLISIMSPMSIDSIVEAALLGKIPPEVNMGSLIETVFLEVNKASPLVVYGYSDVASLLEHIQYHPAGAGHIAIRSKAETGESEIRNYAVRKDGRIQGLMVGTRTENPEVPAMELMGGEAMQVANFKFCDPW